MNKLIEKSRAIETRYRDWFELSPIRASLITCGVTLLSLLIVWTSILGWSGYRIQRDSSALLALVEGDREISGDVVRRADERMRSIHVHTNRVARLTGIPILESIAYRIPAIGPRYESARITVRMAASFADAGAGGTRILRDAYEAFEETGISWEASQTQPTWLQAVDNHRERIPEIVTNLQIAQRLHAEIETELLPARVERRLQLFERFLPMVSDVENLAGDYEAFFHAAGGNGTIRYLLLFQNPAELRPAGGFPGTFGVFEFSYGQLVDYEMFDSHDITRDYMVQRSEKLPQPWAFETFAPQDGFMLHDATWYADFPRSGQLMLQMYAETSWPAVNGVIAIQPEAVSDMVRVTGPVVVEVDEELRTITADNVYDEVERYRRLRFQGEREGVLGDHKDILIDIGEAIMEEFKRAEGTDVAEALSLLLDSAERRNIQVFIDQPAVQAFVEDRGWSGSLIPDPETPTLAVTFTNMVLEKASMAMDPDYAVVIEPDGERGYLVDLTMTLTHTGLHDQDHRYFGFQRWFIQVWLPNGAELIASSEEPAPDPESPDGGVYVVDLFPEDQRDLSIQFSLPRVDRLMIRRQPGQVPPEITVSYPGCDQVWGGYLTRDLTLELTGDCPEFEEIDDQPPRLLMLSGDPLSDSTRRHMASMGYIGRGTR